MFNRKNQIQDMDAYVEERLSDFLDGTLDDQERQIVEAHLASSERARASYESLRYTVNLLKQTPAPALPRQFTLPVTSRAPARAAPPWVVWSLRGIAVAATAAFVLLLTTTLLRQNTPNQAFEQAAPMAAQAQPSVMVALASTPLPTFSTQSQDQMKGQAPPATPIMITVEPPPDTATPEPVTVAADAAASQVQPTTAPAAATEAPPPFPAAAPPPTNSVNTELAPPTPTAIHETTDATAAGSSAPTQNTPVSQPTSSEATTQRTRAAVGIEGVITATRLRVRSGPGMDYPAIGGLRSGELVKILGHDVTGAWLVIEYPQNLETGIGWIGASFVDASLPVENLPIYDAPEPVQPEPEPTDIEPTPALTATDAPTLLPTETATAEDLETPTKESTQEPIAPQATATPES